MSDRMPLGGLDADGPATLHSRISSWIRSQVASGAWPTHFRLKPEPELAAELGVSRGTLRRALATLIGEGVLVQVRGKGTFVTSSIMEPAIAQKLSTLTEDLAEQGIAVTTTCLVREVVPPPPSVAALLHVPAGAPILRLVRLRSTAEGPVALLANYVRTDVAPGIEDTDFATESLFGTLIDRFGLHIGSGRRTFSATAADEGTAAHLQVPVGSPVQYLEQITYLDSGEPIEYSDVWIRSDRLRVTSLLTRP
jgi:GntR family transcriptional regulator